MPKVVVVDLLIVSSFKPKAVVVAAAFEVTVACKSNNAAVLSVFNANKAKGTAVNGWLLISV